MILRHLLRRLLKLNALEGDAGGTGGGAVVDTGAAPAPAVDAPADTSTAAAPAAPAAPSTMLEAIEQHLGQPRDALGRFAPADAAAAAAAGVPAAPAPGAAPAAAAPAQPGAQPAAAQPGQPGAQQPPKEDLLAMPEGLAPKAQERFQKLATANRELTQRTEELNQQVGYISEQFQQHGVRQDQFEQAVGIVGMFNSGDYDGAAKALLGQLQQLSLLTGQNYLQASEADPLAGHADLRQAVDSMQITEAHAMELARARQERQALQQRQQQQVQQQTAQQQEQQAVQQGTQAVDAFCRRMATSDPDYAAIEAKLLPEIGNLLQGVPPQMWPRVVETQYRLLKSVAASSRQPGPAAAPAGQVLRATGQASPAAAPKSMYEAMWGGKG